MVQVKRQKEKKNIADGIRKEKARATVVHLLYMDVAMPFQSVVERRCA